MLILLLGFLHVLGKPLRKRLVSAARHPSKAGDLPKQDYLRGPRPGYDAPDPNKNTSKIWEWSREYLSWPSQKAMTDNLMTRERLARKKHSTRISLEFMWQFQT